MHHQNLAPCPHQFGSKRGGMNSKVVVTAIPSGTCVVREEHIASDPSERAPGFLQAVSTDFESGEARLWNGHVFFRPRRGSPSCLWVPAQQVFNSLLCSCKQRSLAQTHVRQHRQKHQQQRQRQRQLTKPEGRTRAKTPVPGTMPMFTRTCVLGVR